MASRGMRNVENDVTVYAAKDNWGIVKLYSEIDEAA